MTVQFPRSDFSRLPFRLYHDPEVYELEQERVFRGPTWSVLGLEAEIPKPGDFIVTHVGQTGVVVNRLKSGAVGAFVNRCAHRGAEIVREPYGNAADFTCIYHAWCFSEAGDLVGVPFRRGANGKGGMPAEFQMSQHGLQKLRVEVWNGIMFGTFSSDVEPLVDYLGRCFASISARSFRVPSRSSAISVSVFRRTGSFT